MKANTATPLGNTPSKHATSREKSSSTTTPSGDSNRCEKRHSTSADEYSPGKRQRHGSAGGEHSPRRVTSRTPERDTVPKPVIGGSDATPSMYPWSELVEKPNYLGGMGLDWPLARSLYASLPYSSPAAALPSYCTGRVTMLQPLSRTRAQHADDVWLHLSAAVLFLLLPDDADQAAARMFNRLSGHSLVFIFPLAPMLTFTSAVGKLNVRVLWHHHMLL